MQIIKHLNESISVESDKGKFYFGNFDKEVADCICISPKVGISMPGEFEYGDVSISNFENKETPNNTWDVSLVSTEGVNILFVNNPVELSKDEEDMINIANILIVTKANDSNYMHKLISKLDLSMVIGIGFEDKVLDIDTEKISKLKFKPSELLKEEFDLKYYNLG